MSVQTKSPDSEVSELLECPQAPLSIFVRDTNSTESINNRIYNTRLARDIAYFITKDHPVRVIVYADEPIEWEDLIPSLFIHSPSDKFHGGLFNKSFSTPMLLIWDSAKTLPKLLIDVLRQRLEYPSFFCIVTNCKEFNPSTELFDIHYLKGPQPLPPKLYPCKHLYTDIAFWLTTDSIHFIKGYYLSRPICSLSQWEYARERSREK